MGLARSCLPLWRPKQAWQFNLGLRIHLTPLFTHPVSVSSSLFMPAPQMPSQMQLFEELHCSSQWLIKGLGPPRNLQLHEEFSPQLGPATNSTGITPHTATSHGTGGSSRTSNSKESISHQHILDEWTKAPKMWSRISLQKAKLLWDQETDFIPAQLAARFSLIFKKQQLLNYLQTACKGVCVQQHIQTCDFNTELSRFLNKTIDIPSWGPPAVLPL